MVHEIDEDVCLEILKRLSTESVCRFRFVCKRWNSIISSAFFKHLYFTFNVSATPRNLKPYLRATFYGGKIGFHNFKTYFPFQMEEVGKDTKSLIFVGAIHGVVCMVSSLAPTRVPVNFTGRYVGFSINWNLLWNPSIHKYVVLPRVIVADSLFMAEGFGYDASADDFKIIMISGLRVDPNDPNDPNVMSFDVFSVRQGFWRLPLGEVRVERIKDLHEWAFFTIRGCFVNGTVHWLVHKINLDDADIHECCILMFDCESENLTIMDVPEQVSGPNYKNFVRLFEYAGMLATLVNSHRHSMSMSLWVMKEHGVPTSWKKLYTVNAVYPYLGVNDGGEGEDSDDEGEGEDLDDEGDLDDGEEGEDLTPCEIIRIDPSFEIEKRVPYGPSNLWWERLDILEKHVYNKSLFLIDHPKPQSYLDEDIIYV